MNFIFVVALEHTGTLDTDFTTRIRLILRSVVHFRNINKFHFWKKKRQNTDNNTLTLTRNFFPQASHYICLFFSFFYTSCLIALGLLIFFFWLLYWLKTKTTWTYYLTFKSTLYLLTKQCLSHRSSEGWQIHGLQNKT